MVSFRLLTVILLCSTLLNCNLVIAYRCFVVVFLKFPAYGQLIVLESHLREDFALML